MPIYEYRCEKCRKHHEIMQKITEKPLSICPNCGGNMKKLISNTSFVLKGTGWYVTDYSDQAKKSRKEKTSSEKKDKDGGSAEKEPKKETASTGESKKGTKSEQKTSKKQKD